MTRTFHGFVAAGVLTLSSSLFAQAPTAPAISFDANANLLQTPDGVFLGEVGGVGQTSKGQIFVYTRTTHPYATLGDNRTFFRNGSKLFQFDATGKFVRELGQDVYGFNMAYGLRVDPQDNVWAIDNGANQVIKFDGDGRVALVLGRKPEAIGVRPAQGGGGGRPPAPGQLPGAGTPGSTFNQPSDVAWDKAGNIYITDGMAGNVNRVAKFNKDGNFVKQWGSTGDGPGQFKGLKAIAVDAKGDVYVADAGNKRIQVFDGEGTFKREFGNIGSPLTMCMTQGATQYLYISHSGDPDGMVDAAILKVSLDGKVVGRFGEAGKLPKQFGLANSIDCRNERELLVGELTNWRVQKLSLK